MSKPHDGAMINLIKTQKNTDGEYLNQMKTFKRIDLTPNKQEYTQERHPAKKKNKTKQKKQANKQKVGKTELNDDTDDINCDKIGESFVFKESKSKSF